MVFCCLRLLISFNIPSSIQFLANVMISFFSSQLKFHCICILSVHLPTSRLGPSLGIMKHAAMNTEVQVCLWYSLKSLQQMCWVIWCF